MKNRKFSIGLDFGTNSVRALIAALDDGEEIATSIYQYQGGKDGIIVSDSDSNLARQDPNEYLAGMEVCVRETIEEARKKYGKSFSPEEIVGIGVDTTGSSPIPVDEKCLPLSFKPEFKNNPNAMTWLWKDHTSFEEASLITAKAKKFKQDYTEYCGGIYSSEWFFSKILHLARVDRKVYEASSSFVEHCDLMPAILTGETNPLLLKRSRCAAGHKAMYNAAWDGLPSQEFLSGVDPVLDGLRAKLYDETYTADFKAGGLCREWAGKLGLPEGIAVTAGAFDAHMGAVGAGIGHGTLVKIMGTSTCDMMVVPHGALTKSIKGVCGQVDGSIVPGYTGVEAGQSAVGDIFAWYREQVLWAIKNILPLTPEGKSVDTGKLFSESRRIAYEVLTEKAKLLKPGESGLLSLDWLNGNRTVLVDPNLTGQITGLTLGTCPEEIFLSLIEGTAFGSKVIMERIKEYGVKINEVVTCGGLAESNPFILQVYANVLNVPIKVSRAVQTCALGAAMFGAVAGGYFSKVEDAQKQMSGVKDVVYQPVPDTVNVYSETFRLYRELHDSFGTEEFKGNLYHVMKELLKIKRTNL